MEDKGSNNSLRDHISKEITDFLVEVLRSDEDGGKKEAAIKNKMKAAEMLEKRLNIFYDEGDSVTIIDDIPDEESVENG